VEKLVIAGEIVLLGPDSLVVTPDIAVIVADKLVSNRVRSFVARDKLLIVADTLVRRVERDPIGVLWPAIAAPALDRTELLLISWDKHVIRMLVALCSGR
jgi:hypothetical protein